jgi:hypothetical protein
MNSFIKPKPRKYNVKQLIYYNNYGSSTTCNCIKEEKYLFGSSSPSEVLPYNERISLIILASKGGRIHFGNAYLGEQDATNYLGRYEGQPGGGGKPIRNKF